MGDLDVSILLSYDREICGQMEKFREEWMARSEEAANTTIYEQERDRKSECELTSAIVSPALWEEQPS